MASGKTQYLMKCTGCKGKITNTGQMVGVDKNCIHNFKPLVVVIPTDAERRWIDLNDRNNAECQRHYDQFENDLDEIASRKEKALEQIAAKIERLKGLLDSRQQVLETEVRNAFKERFSKMKANMAALKQQQEHNDDAKESNQDLLTGDKAVDEREKIIVGRCEKILSGTPKLQFIETELHFTFESESTIQRKIENFGVLHFKPLGSGERCVFESTLDASTQSVGPKRVTLPKVELKTSALDQVSKRLKLSFRLDPKKEEVDEHILDHLSVRVMCCEDTEEDEKADDSQPIYEQLVKFRSCKFLEAKSRYEITVDHAFKAGLTISSKLRAEFTSPDRTKYSDAKGPWCQDQNFDFPAEDLEFNLSLNGRSMTMKLYPDHKALDDFNLFAAEFMKAFNQSVEPGAKLMLISATDGPLNEGSDLRKLGSGNVVITGLVQSEQPEPARNSHPEKPVVPSSPEQSLSPRASKGKAKKSQISTVAVFGSEKKRVILKRNPKKKLDEYNMKDLREKVCKKFKQKGLSGDFTLILASGQGTVIETDQDIENHLTGYDGEILVEQPQ